MPTPTHVSWKLRLWVVSLLAAGCFSPRFVVVNGFPFSPTAEFVSDAPPWTAYPEKMSRAGANDPRKPQPPTGQQMNSLTEISGRAGFSALNQVQSLASKVAETRVGSVRDATRMSRRSKSDSVSVQGTGGLVYNNKKFMSKGTQVDPMSVAESNFEVSADSAKQDQVWTALANLELDMQMLDKLAGQRPQLTALEFSLLSLSVFAAASGPWILGGALTEFLAPSAAAFSAAIGIGAEYVGRVKVADGKEVAAATIQCAAEAEGLLANAERSKAIAPLCVGVGASVTAIALLVPALLVNFGEVLKAEVYLACPLISVLAAAVASLALQETKFFCARATSVGNRRWAKSGLVGRSWLSTSEQIVSKSASTRDKWKTFVLSVLPAPVFGSLIPGTGLATKAIIVTAVAAAQSALYLSYCEFYTARAQDAVALKARSAAVCDTYANQGARSSAILPFTSALSGLCAAATAAIVELPFLESLSATGAVTGIAGEMVAVAFFPTLSAMFAAAASVSKARCEVDAEAAVQAANTLALEYVEGEDPILQPFKGVLELVQLSYRTTIVKPIERFLRSIRMLRPLLVLKRLFDRRQAKDKMEQAASTA